ncbi:serine/threonine-protein kinase [Actinoplanes subtropicus]|uniref:serine/threonine-protein kinase n=1 Tax=Actinoplanes subtropicus TaxID=543632 RepID=UPI003CCBF0C3
MHDFGTCADQPYIVMELVEGRTLGEHLRTGPLDWRIAVRICAEVSAGLAAAHAEHVVHRDIKPSNVMLTPSGAKVLDFGIAATVGSADPDPDGPVMGTPAFVAPERFAGHPATPATDMFAVGTLLYQCLSGRLPWTAGSPSELVEATCKLDPEPLPEIDALPPEVADLCSRCLAKDPADRPTALVAALLLGEAVDARVYVPLRDLAPVVVSHWMDEPTSQAGRHRAADRRTG